MSENIWFCVLTLLELKLKLKKKNGCAHRIPPERNLGFPSLERPALCSLLYLLVLLFEVFNMYAYVNLSKILFLRERACAS